MTDTRCHELDNGQFNFRLYSRKIYYLLLHIDQME